MSSKLSSRPDSEAFSGRETSLVSLFNSLGPSGPDLKACIKWTNHHTPLVFPHLGSAALDELMEEFDAHGVGATRTQVTEIEKMAQNRAAKGLGLAFRELFFSPESGILREITEGHTSGSRPAIISPLYQNGPALAAILNGTPVTASPPLSIKRGKDKGKLPPRAADSPHTLPPLSPRHRLVAAAALLGRYPVLEEGEIKGMTEGREAAIRILETGLEDMTRHISTDELKADKKIHLTDIQMLRRWGILMERKRLFRMFGDHMIVEMEGMEHEHLVTPVHAGIPHLMQLRTDNKPSGMSSLAQAHLTRILPDGPIEIEGLETLSIPAHLALGKEVSEDSRIALPDLSQEELVKAGQNLGINASLHSNRPELEKAILARIQDSHAMVGVA